MQQPGTFERFSPELEAELKKQGGGRQSPFYDMLRYHMGWDDGTGRPLEHTPPDRVFGAVCLLSAEAVGADYQTVLPAAAGVEMAFGFAQIHEEIRLGTPERGDRQALWWVWGHSQGINVGDGLYALARLAVMDLEPAGAPPEIALRAATTLDRYCLEICECQFKEIEIQAGPETSVEEQMNVFYGTDGALMGCASEIGALGGLADERTIEAFAVFGRKVGVAFRVRRDLEAIWGNGPSGRSRVVDIIDGRRSLPIIYALENATGAGLSLIHQVAARERVVENKDIDEILSVLEDVGARRYAEEKVERYVAEGIQALDRSGVGSEAVAQLKALAGYLVGPKE